MLAIQKKRVRILPVYPAFPDNSFWSYKGAIKLMGNGLKAVMPPTGLITVAAMLPEKHFEILPVIDLNVERLTKEQILSADILMISAMIVQRESLAEIIAWAKRLGKKILVGGPYATSYQKEVLAMGADHLVLGEAEVTLAPFIADFLAGRAVAIYDEHSVRSRSQSVELTRGGKPKITATPLPRWDLLNLKRYFSAAVQYSRGCPFDCDFCDITKLYGRESRTKTPAQMIAELEAIYQTGWRGSVFIVDDNFIGNVPELRRFLPVLTAWQKAHDYPFDFFTEASLNLANQNLRDVLEEMVRAGFNQVFVGIESFNPEVIRAMSKGQNLGGSTVEKVHVLQRAGLEVIAGFIVGNDGDGSDVFTEMFAGIQESGVVIPMAGLLTALRGTALYRRLEAEGRLVTESKGNPTHELDLNFMPTMDKKLLIAGYVRLLEQLFASKNYYARCRVLRKHRGPHHRFSRVNRASILAALRVFYINLIKRPDWQFVKFVIGTAIKAPSELPEALTQAVKLHHFRTMTEALVAAHHYPEVVATLVECFQEQVARLRGDVEERLARLAKLKRRYVAQATALYERLPRDFQASTREALEAWQARLDQFVETCCQTWQATSPAR